MISSHASRDEAMLALFDQNGKQDTTKKNKDRKGMLVSWQAQIGCEGRVQGEMKMDERRGKENEGRERTQSGSCDA
jgi:hypothetical protein